MTTTQLLNIVVGPGGLLVGLLIILFLGARTPPLWVFGSVYLTEQQRRIQAEQERDRAIESAQRAQERLVEAQQAMDRTIALMVGYSRGAIPPGQGVSR